MYIDVASLHAVPAVDLVLRYADVAHRVLLFRSSGLADAYDDIRLTSPPLLVLDSTGVEQT